MIRRAGARKKELFFAYSLLIPTILLLTVVIVIPLVESVYLSFTDTSLISFNTRNMIGLDNYRALLKSDTFHTIILNTLVIVLSTVAISLLLGLLLALLLDHAPFARVLRGILIIPWLIPGVVIGIIWKWVLATEAGVLNYLLRSIGILDTNFAFLSNTKVTIWFVILVFIWTSVPYIMVTALAALQAVPKELEEAAIIDGTTSVQRFFSIVIPFITPILSTAIILRIIYTMQDFAIIWSLTAGGPGISTETFVINVYKTAFNSTKIGMACAVGVVWLLVLSVFVMIYFKIQKANEQRLYE
ncbi:MAG: carbohydrate ABC transporter permease [Sphaerochaetaceae bacterium]